jgi:S1-C subfamily serine protease
MKIAAAVVLALHPVGICWAAETDPIPKSVPTMRLAQERQTRVVLHEEDQHDPMGRQFVGSAVWRAERIGPGQSSGIAVRAQIEIPARGIALRWSLQRNDDKALPASHTVEIIFTPSPNFPHGGIASVPGLLTKQGEATRGAPLVGRAVKVTTNSFLIGLSSVDADMQRNVQALKERPWFDIPVIYDDGQRAIVALEKGVPGERAFAEAFASWGGAVAKTSPAPSSPPRPVTTSGTGFFVTNRGHVVTAAHVVDGCVRLTIQYGGATRTARLEQLEKTNDVAVLDTDVTPVRAAKWRPAVRLGEDVVVYGFPLSGMLASDGNVTTGIVTALAGLRDDSRLFQLSAPVQRGNSGGPVLDRSGNVVGIVVAKLDVARLAEQLHDTAQNVNFAVKSGVALAALRAWGTAVAEDQAAAPFSTPDLVDFAKGFTVHVICERPPATAAAASPANGSAEPRASPFAPLLSPAPRAPSSPDRSPGSAQSPMAPNSTGPKRVGTIIIRPDEAERKRNSATPPLRAPTADGLGVTVESPGSATR